MILKNLTLFSLFIIFSESCAIKTNLTKNDLKWLDVYHEGDTLIFQSATGEYDTSVIIKKEIYYPDYTPIETHGKYLPQTGVIWYQNKKLQYNSDGARLIQIIKETPKKTSLFLNYLYAGIIVVNLENGNIEKYKHDKTYEFDTYHENTKLQEPKEIFWDEDIGIIKYITHDNEIWIRIK